MTAFALKRSNKSEQVAVAEDARRKAQKALEEAQSRRSVVESLSSFMRDRTKENGFGDTFTISMTPRGT